MPLTIQELIDNPERIAELHLEPEKCGKCGEPISGALTGRHYVKEHGRVCDDCYYDLFGEELDKHPIGSAK